jgi:acyl-CoA thioester hydrolase
VKIHVPSVEHVRALECLVEYVVPPEWQDINGHVNVRHYLDLYNLAGDAVFTQMGVTEDYFLKEHRGFFDLEHHIWYLAELHVGDRVSVHTRYVARSGKRYQGLLFVVNLSRPAVACVLEFVSTGANLASRRAEDFAPQVAARLDALIATHAKLPWPAPLSGAISP